MAFFRLSRRAKVDVEAIWQYGIDQFGIDQANRLLDRLEERFRSLAKQPRQGRLRDEIRPGLRSVSLETYVI